MKQTHNRQVTVLVIWMKPKQYETSTFKRFEKSIIWNEICMSVKAKLKRETRHRFPLRENKKWVEKIQTTLKSLM